MTDYTPSDLPRLMVESIKRIRVPNPLRHNRQLVGITNAGQRVVLHTWYSVSGSYAARVPKKICPHIQTLTVEKLAYTE
jgi:hypothetical protein